MPVAEEEFKSAVTAIGLSSWNAETVYSELSRADLDEVQKAALKQAYDLREFYRDETLAHLSYNLIPKEGPEENRVRNSITKIGFLNNNYQFAFIAADDSKKIEAWKARNMRNPDISVLIVRPTPGLLRASKPKLLVLSEGLVQELAVTPEQIDRILAANGVPAATEITSLENTEDSRKVLADIYQENGLHIPFKLCAQNDLGDYFIPSREGKFSWERTTVDLAPQTYGLYDVKRFTRAAGEAVAAETAVPLAVIDQSPRWVDPALKCFVLSPHIESDHHHPETGKVTMLWAGTHDGATARADAEPNGAGYRSFSTNKEDFLQLMRPIVAKAAATHDGTVDITACGHSLGGALSQLSLQAVLSDDNCRRNISSLSLAIKNSTGVGEGVATDYKRLVEDNPHLTHETRAILVDGDAVQQTGESTLGCDIKPNQCKLSLCKVVTPISLPGVLRRTVYGAAVITAGASAALLTAPVTIAAAAGWFALGGVFALGGIAAAGARGAYAVHTRQYFNGGLKECRPEYYNSETEAGRSAIAKELLNKSVLPAAGLRVLHGKAAPAVGVTAPDTTAPDVPTVAEGVAKTAPPTSALLEDVRLSAVAAAEPTRASGVSPQSASSTDASVTPPPPGSPKGSTSLKGARRGSKSPS